MIVDILLVTAGPEGAHEAQRVRKIERARGVDGTISGMHSSILACGRDIPMSGSFPRAPPQRDYLALRA